MTLKNYHLALGIGFLLAVVSVGSQPTFAQSTIFNIPSTDVVAAKKTYVEFDVIAHLESHKDGGFQTYVPRVVFGDDGALGVLVERESMMRVLPLEGERPRMRT